jgi:Tol biopolymer transport system component
LLITDKNSDSSIAIMDADGSNKFRVFPAQGGVAFSPSWSPDGQWIVFGVGGFLQDRHQKPAKIMMARRDGTSLQDLTQGEPNAEFPSWSPDGNQIVYRDWGAKEIGLRILNLEDRSIRVLTTEYYNLPFWSPTGARIVFTRKANDNFDIFTIRPDGSELRRLTTSPANDGHAVWTDDGKHVLWSSGQAGWKDEAAQYDDTFQPYGAILMMKADSTEKRQLTDSLWGTRCLVLCRWPSVAIPANQTGEKVRQALNPARPAFVLGNAIYLIDRSGWNGDCLLLELCGISANFKCGNV